jgi:uncharacterized phage protein (TIGR01671 family)
MRELKFRIWNSIENKWNGLQHNSPIMIGELCCLNGVYLIPESVSRNLVLQQYTGLKDKNGKEICEGDYIKNSDGLIMSVKWNQARCCFAASVSTEDGWLNLLKDLIKDFEVVGNIFENPELLKQ